MEFGVIIILIPGLLALVFVMATYNRLVGLRNYIRDSRANIDTELKRRHDLIPNLVATVKGYAAHEEQVLARVVELRKQALESIRASRLAEATGSEQELSRSLSQLIALAENYPDLKADGQFLALQKELVNTEDRIQAARRFFNGNVRDYRNACEQFPSSMVAGMFGFSPESYFDVDPSVREVPSTRFN